MSKNTSLHCPSLKSVIEMETSSKESIGLEIEVSALITEAMTGKVTRGHGLSTVEAMGAIEIRDLVVLSIEETITDMIGIDAISTINSGAAARHLGIMVIEVITVVILIITEAEVIHQADINEDKATSVTIIISEVVNHVVNIETRIGNNLKIIITTTHIVPIMMTEVVVHKVLVVLIMVLVCQI